MACHSIDEMISNRLSLSNYVINTHLHCTQTLLMDIPSETCYFTFMKYTESIASRVRGSRQIFSSHFDTIEPFGTFTKAVEETFDIAEASKCTFTPAQVVENPSTAF